VQVERLDGADAVLAHAHGLLRDDETRNNLPFGILSTARAHPGLYPEVVGWIVRDAGAVVGAALRTPPFQLVLVRPSVDGALAALAAEIDDELPGVVGAVPEVDVFAQEWAARRGVAVEPTLEQGVYALRRVRAPSGVPGAMRLAGTGDRPLLLDWFRAFSDEVLHGSLLAAPERLARNIDARLAGGDAGFGLWEVDGRPVSLAGFGGPTPNGIRIGPVYTPPELRGRGYASALTAAVTQLQLDRGKRFCFLYTDLANPTSNAIYMRIGYERVCESRELAFGAS
jgi:uncharacterized protein